MLGGVACLLGALLCGVFAVAVRGGFVAPPSASLHVGPLGIEAGLAPKPECPPHCEWQVPTSGQRGYTVWLVSATNDAQGEHTQTWLLYAQPAR